MKTSDTLKEGHTYGKLLIKEVGVKAPKVGFGRAALCDCLRCGRKDVVLRARSIRSGHTVTCGCTHTKHYKTKSTKYYRRLYEVWCQIKYRCYNSDNKNYFQYGGRGIKMSDDWKDFGTFYNDMIDTYKPGLTIERKDVDGNYCKENCKWITNQEQALNRRSSLEYRKRTGYRWAFAKADL